MHLCSRAARVHWVTLALLRNLHHSSHSQLSHPNARVSIHLHVATWSNSRPSASCLQWSVSVICLVSPPSRNCLVSPPSRNLSVHTCTLEYLGGRRAVGAQSLIAKITMGMHCVLDAVPCGRSRGSRPVACRKDNHCLLFALIRNLNR